MRRGSWDMEGIYPGDLDGLTVDAKYLSAIPSAKTPNYHSDSASVKNGSDFADVDDTNGWIYGVEASVTDTWGQIYVNCTHTDSKGSIWVQY